MLCAWRKDRRAQPALSIAEPLPTIMKKRYKYEKGIVIENGDEKIILRKDLEDEGIRTKYKHKLILDESKEFKLHIRSRGKSSHFYSRGTSRRNIRNNYYSEPHKEKVKILHNFINARDRVRICTYYWSWEDKKMKLDTIFSLKEYYFQKEVKRTINNKKYFVSDIFGISKTLNNSDKEPQISIEVIDTHFPSQTTFDFFRFATKNSPLIILFYYLEFEPKLNQMLNNKGEGNNGKLRVSHYIQDGSFWVGDERIEEKDFSYIKTYNKEIDFENNEEYYKSINELILSKL